MFSPDLPIVATGLGIILSLATLLIRQVTKDRGAGFELAEYRAADLVALAGRLSETEEKLELQREENHRNINELAVLRGERAIIRALAEAGNIDALRAMPNITWGPGPE